MKTTSSPLPLLALCLITALLGACIRQSNSLQLLMKDIQAQGDTLPQEALQRLEKAGKAGLEDHTEHERKRWDLLRMRLRDKCGIAPTSADSMIQICDYFEHKGSKREQAEACYYMACTYRDLNDYPQACIWLLKAAEAAEQDPAYDPFLLRDIYAQTAYLHFKQLNHEMGLQAALNVLRVAKKHHIEELYSSMHAASGYFLLNDSAKARPYCDQTLEAMEIAQGPWDTSIAADLLGIYTTWGDSAKAARCLNILQQLEPHKRPSNYLLGLGEYHNIFGSPDSAAQCYREMYATHSEWEYKCYAAQQLMLHHHARGEHERAAHYGMAYQQTCDSLLAERQQELTAKAHGEYIYNRNRERESQSLLEAEQARSRNLLLALTGAAATLFSTLIYALHKKRTLRRLQAKDHEIHHSRETLRMRDEEISRQQTLLARREEELEQKKRQLLDKDEEITLMNAEIGRRQAELNKRQQQMDDLMRLALMAQATLEGSDIVEKFKRAGEGQEQVTKQDWQELITLLDRIHPTFTPTIHARIDRLTESRIQTCYLLKMGCSNSQICNILNQPRQTVWNRVKALRAILGEELRDKSQPGLDEVPCA